MEYLLKNDFYTVTVSDIGAEMISIKDKSQRELVWQPAENAGWTYRTPWLFPICSRLFENSYEYNGKKYTMPMHGFIRFVKMDVLDSDSTSVTMRSVSADTVSYPFEYSFTVTYRLIGDTIRMDIKIENLDTKEMPYMLGWHPGFVLLADSRLPIENYSVIFENAKDIRVLPKGTRPDGIPYDKKSNVYNFDVKEIDDTQIFKGQGNSATLFADGCPRKLSMKWSDSFPYYCIWRGNKPGADYICLEPWSDMIVDSGIPESFETKPMSRLAPGKSREYFCELKFT